MPTAAAAAKTVIVADDAAFVRDRFKAALEQAGHHVLAVDSAAALLARLREDVASVHLVLVDVRLSPGSGPALVAQIRQLDDGRLPVLVFSGTVGSAADVRELEIGRAHV